MRSFRGRLTLLVLAAFALRLVYALAVAPGTAGAVDDAFWYQSVSFNIAHGHGFMVPFQTTVLPTAEHGPLYPLALAGAIKLGITGDSLLRSLGAIFGAVTVTSVGLIGRRVGGETLGLVAAAIAAVSPLLIAADGALLSETLYGATIALSLLGALRLLDRPTVRNAALTGVLIALAALTRSEALVLLPLVAVPLAWRGGRPGRWLRVAAPLVCAAVVIAPWVARNWSVFDRPVLTNNEGDLLAASNCDSTYHGIDIGFEELLCLGKATGNEAQKAAQWRSQGLGYARDHAARLAVVVPVRFLRTWGLFQPFRSSQERTRDPRLTKAGVIFGYFLTALAIAGAIRLWRRRRAEVLVLLAPILMVSLAAMASYGSLRFRHAAEIPLCVLGGAGAIWLVERVRARRQGSATAASASSRVA